MAEPLFFMDFSQEELVVLLWLMRTPTLPGLGRDPLNGLTGEAAASALGSADRALRARGMVLINEVGQVGLDQGALALLGTCAAPDITVLYTTMRSEGLPSMRYLYATDLMTVEHTNATPGVHRFAALGKRSTLIQRLEELVSVVNEKAPDREAIQLSGDALRSAARTMKEIGNESAIALLIDKGISQTVATDFVGSLSGLSQAIMVAVRRAQRSGHPESEALVLLQTAEGYYELEDSTSGESDSVTVKPCTGSDVSKRLRSLVAATVS